MGGLLPHIIETGILGVLLATTIYLLIMVMKERREIIKEKDDTIKELSDSILEVVRENTEVQVSLIKEIEASTRASETLTSAVYRVLGRKNDTRSNANR